MLVKFCLKFLDLYASIYGNSKFHSVKFTVPERKHISRSGIEIGLFWQHFSLESWLKISGGKHQPSVCPKVMIIFCTQRLISGLPFGLFELILQKQNDLNTFWPFIDFVSFKAFFEVTLNKNIIHCFTKFHNLFY
jgi:hypothetical protein